MRKIAVFLILSGLVGCTDDAPQMEAVRNQLTTGSSKSWKIASATLKGATTDYLSVSDLANVNDDEFVFTADPSATNVAQMNWHIRNQIRASATTTQEALLDYYLSALTRTLTIQGNGSITLDDPNLQIEVISNGQLAIQYQLGASEFSLNLVPAGETTFVPATLEFEFLSEIVGTALGLEQAAGFTGSMASNSLYFAYKAFDGATADTNPERVVRYDIDEGTFTTSNFINQDFVTKELHIINDELKVVGAQFVNTYPLDLASPPVSVPHNLTLTRYGSTVVDNNVFLFGGDLSFLTGADPLNTDAEKIYQHDQVTGQLNEVGVLPEQRYWAHGEIVDGKLFVFGGRQVFITEVAEDDIFIHDMTSGENQTLKLPTAMHRTFAARYGHLIYVAGQRDIPNADPALSTVETTFGVFDTHTNNFTIISNNLDFTGKKTVFGLTIVGDKLFILYGVWGEGTFSIYDASIADDV
jgi:hypothetical protein